MQEEEVTEIPLIYPLVSIILKSVSIVDGRRVLHECEEIIDVRGGANKKQIARLVGEFKAYVQKVIAEATSQKGRAALQNILDNHSQDPSRLAGDPPSSPAPATEPDQGTAPSGSPAA